MNLDEKHRAELRASGLTDEIIAAADIYSAEGDAIREILGWKPRHHDWGRAMVFPFRSEGATPYARVKLDFPRQDDDGRLMKYESPKGKGNRAYLPPGFDSRATEIILTEGEKKSLAAQQAGINCIGLVGVWGWQEKRRRDDHGKPFGARKLIAELDSMDWRGRRVVIAFDSDAVTKPDVQLAESRLAEVLNQRGAEVFVARLPQAVGEKVGLDDFLVAHSVEDLRAVLASATPAETPKPPGPMELAKAFLEDQFMTEAGITLRWHRNEFLIWRNTHYATLDESELVAGATSWLDGRTVVRPRLASDMVKCLAALCRVQFSIDLPTWLGRDDCGDIMAFANGIVEIKGQAIEIHEHTPLWLSRSCLDFNFDADAKCPHWEKFLNETLIDPKLIELLQQWFGYCLTNETHHHKMLLMVGPARSGKSLICNALHRTVGAEACTSPSLSSLGGAFGLWPLVNKTVAILADAHIGKSADHIQVLETIKSITGEDAKNVHRKCLPTLQNIRLLVRFVVTVNELPHFSDASGAMADRLLVIPFTISHTGKEDRTLNGKFIAESAGIFNWALRGLHKLRTAKVFTTPPASQVVVDNFRRLSSPVHGFVEDCCDVGASHTVLTVDVFDAWRQWCELNGHLLGSSATLGDKLRTVVPTLQRKRQTEEPRPYEYHGLKLNSQGATMAEVWQARQWSDDVKSPGKARKKGAPSAA